MDIVFRKLELAAALSAEEKGALRSTFRLNRKFDAGQDLLQEGAAPSLVGALLSGMLCRYKRVADGLRQIVSLSLPGDIFDLHSFTIQTMDHSIGAVMRSTVATAKPAALAQVAEAYPRLGVLLWREAVVESSVFREWIVNCGRRRAYSRIAHLLCEIYVRSAEVGLAKDGACPLPLTQCDLGDATGLSVVHVNRVLHLLRTQKLIAFGARRLTVLDWAGLAEAADFSPAYLHARENIRPPVREFHSHSGGRDLVRAVASESTGRDR